MFAVEMTTAIGTCGGCGAAGPVGAIHVYRGAGIVLRCPHCDNTLAKIVKNGTLGAGICTRVLPEQYVGSSDPGEGWSSGRMTDWAVFADATEDEATASLPRFARKAVNRKDSPTLATLQWKAALDTAIKKQLLGSMIEPLSKELLQLVRPRGRQAIGDGAFRAFLSAVDTERWWLGDIALVSSNGDNVTLIKPDADGLFINVYSWGPDRVSANRRWLTSMSLIADGSGPRL